MQPYCCVADMWLLPVLFKHYVVSWEGFSIYLVYCRHTFHSDSEHTGHLNRLLQLQSPQGSPVPLKPGITDIICCKCSDSGNPLVLLQPLAQSSSWNECKATDFKSQSYFKTLHSWLFFFFFFGLSALFVFSLTGRVFFLQELLISLR